MACPIPYGAHNKCGLLPFDSVVSICSDFYTNSEVEIARALLAEHNYRTMQLC